MTCKERLEHYLEDAAVPYSFQHHRTVFTTQEVAQTEHIPGRMMAKPVIVNADGALTMVVLPASEKLDLAKTTQALHAHEARLASEEEFRRAFPDCETGAMPVFGNLYQIPVLIDRCLSENESIVCQAGTHADTVRVRYVDFIHMVQPDIAELHH